LIETCDCQDKEGCSLNGSNEFLEESGILRYYSIHSIIIDSREIVVNLKMEIYLIILKNLIESKTMLNFNQFVGKVRSTIPIVEEKREVFETIFPTIFITIIYFDDLNFSS